MDELGQVLIDTVRRQVTEGYPAQIRAALDALSDEEVWGRANTQSNSVGNLVLHLCGSTRHFIGRGVGDSNYQRDRPAEFAERGPIPREELLRLLDETVREADAILAGLVPSRLLETTDRVGEPFPVVALLLRVSHHWAIHTGQIVFTTKARREGALQELWQKTMR